MDILSSYGQRVGFWMIERGNRISWSGREVGSSERLYWNARRIYLLCMTLQYIR